MTKWCDSFAPTVFFSDIHRNISKIPRRLRGRLRQGDRYPAWWHVVNGRENDAGP
jgi:hypothetical protein